MLERASKPNYIRIGKLAKLLGEYDHVVRYWGAEFEILPFKLKPDNPRAYDHIAVEEFQLVRNLLRKEFRTIEGAKIKLKLFRGRRKLSARTIVHEVR